MLHKRFSKALVSILREEGLMSERGETMEESRILSATRRVAEVFFQEVSLRQLWFRAFSPSLTTVSCFLVSPGGRLRFLRGVLCRSRRSSPSHPSGRDHAGMDLLRTTLLKPRSISDASNAQSTPLFSNRLLRWTTSSSVSDRFYHSHLRFLP